MNLYYVESNLSNKEYIVATSLLKAIEIMKSEYSSEIVFVKLIKRNILGEF